MTAVEAQMAASLSENEVLELALRIVPLIVPLHDDTKYILSETVAGKSDKAIARDIGMAEHQHVHARFVRTCNKFGLADRFHPDDPDFQLILRTAMPFVEEEEKRIAAEERTRRLAEQAAHESEAPVSEVRQSRQPTERKKPAPTTTSKPVTTQPVRREPTASASSTPKPAPIDSDSYASLAASVAAKLRTAVFPPSRKEVLELNAEGCTPDQIAAKTRREVNAIFVAFTVIYGMFSIPKELGGRILTGIEKRDVLRRAWKEAFPEESTAQSGTQPDSTSLSAPADTVASNDSQAPSEEVLCADTDVFALTHPPEETLEAANEDEGLVELHEPEPDTQGTLNLESASAEAPIAPAPAEHVEMVVHGQQDTSERSDEVQAAPKSSCDPSILDAIVREVAQTIRTKDEQGKLSAVRKELLLLHAKGFSSLDIALQVKKKLNTVQVRFVDAFDALGVPGSLLSSEKRDVLRRAACSAFGIGEDEVSLDQVVPSPEEIAEHLNAVTEPSAPSIELSGSPPGSQNEGADSGETARVLAAVDQVAERIRQAKRLEPRDTFLRLIAQGCSLPEIKTAMPTVKTAPSVARGNAFVSFGVPLDWPMGERADLLRLAARKAFGEIEQEVPPVPVPLEAVPDDVPEQPAKRTLDQAQHSADVHVAQRLRELRKLRGMSVAEFNECLGETCQNVRATNRYDASSLWMASQALNVPVSYFFEGLPGQDPVVALPLTSVGDVRARQMLRGFAGALRTFTDEIEKLTE